FLMGADHPIAWLKEFEGGRSFYTNQGHRPETWYEADFIRHVIEGIKWAAEPTAWNRIVLTDAPRNPMSLKVAPDGRVFYVERTGELMGWSPVTGRTTEVGAVAVDTVAESGMLALALDPDFASNRALYLYYSEATEAHGHGAAGPKHSEDTGAPGDNVLSRFTLAADGRLDMESRTDVLRVPSERACCHEGADLQFAPDGALYLSTGDNTDPFSSDGYAPIDERPGRERFNAQRTAANPFDPRGKILRINPDGTVPAGNLFPADGSQGRPEVFVMGTRNPFRIAVDPATGRLYWGDVGPDAASDSALGPRGYDEINVADRPGNYGWPFCIGANLPYTDRDYATGEQRGPFSCAGFVPAALAYDYST
ncbi:MAG: PQQ-dependent sugar dehydrogenase, partial [Candidatus Methylomirabilis sp.]|nr:PQQ-dependent sugar dehydrogenase [Deltaproteobacteria bacterium]